ncbi:MAG: LytR/AlgR family response regulator transcription factor [Syntrophothermus sp.]
MVKVVLVDYDIEITDTLAVMLKKYEDIEITGIFNDAEQAQEELLSLQPDLIFMDLEMQEKSGIDLTRELYQNGLEVPVIFITDFNQSAIETLHYAAFDYIIKPVDEEELQQAIGRFRVKSIKESQEEQIRKLLEKISGEKKIKISIAGGLSLINPMEIIFVEADWNYSDICFAKDKREKVSLNIGKVLELLPAEYFFRISRSLIINKHYITRINRKKSTLTLEKNNEEHIFTIPILNLRKLESML